MGAAVGVLCLLKNIVHCSESDKSVFPHSFLNPDWIHMLSDSCLLNSSPSFN